MTSCVIDADMEALLACGARIVQVARRDKRPLGYAWQTLSTDDPEQEEIFKRGFDRETEMELSDRRIDADPHRAGAGHRFASVPRCS